MLYFICMGSVDLSGARWKRKNTKWKILANIGTRTHNFEICSLSLDRLNYPGLMTALLLKWIYKFMCFPNHSIHLSGIHTSLLSTGRKRLASQFKFTYRYIDDVLSINNPDFGNYLGQMYPPELEIKDTTESDTSASYLDLPLSIGSDGHLHTSLYTSVTSLISILQTFRSWAATSHLRPPMAFVSHNSSDTPGLAPLMNVLFWGRCDFPISFSGRDM